MELQTVPGMKAQTHPMLLPVVKAIAKDANPLEAFSLEVQLTDYSVQYSMICLSAW